MNSLRNLTRVGADMRQIAALLQSQGRQGDTMLAHITPKEAALLRARGGAGTTNPATGLPEFYEYDGDYDMSNVDYSQYGAQPETPVAESFPVASEGYGTPPETSGDYSFTPDFGERQQYEAAIPSFEAPPPTPSFRPSQDYGPGMTGAETAAYDLATRAAAQPAAPAAAPGGLSEQMKQRLGLAGIQALGIGLLARRAGQQAQRGAQQISQLGAPYRAKGAELMGLAQQGQLTAVTQQQLEQLRARAAQQAAGRGGVGAAQVANQVEAFRQQLLQQQYDLGLKLSGISDQYALQAIKSGMSADQAVNSMLGQAMNNIGRIFAGQPRPQVPGQPPGG